ncbi:MAG: 30S ribosomal protein S4, partial [Proteobacteria bacterium]|nr:30S ribosomal protein S4 [Pseudomonadota bacterium]
KVGDKIALKESSQKLVSLEKSREIFSLHPPVNWIEVKEDRLSGSVIALPTRDDVQLAVKDHLIVELYSK